MLLVRFEDLASPIYFGAVKLRPVIVLIFIFSRKEIYAQRHNRPSITMSHRVFEGTKDNTISDTRSVRVEVVPVYPRKSGALLIGSKGVSAIGGLSRLGRFSGRDE